MEVDLWQSTTADSEHGAVMETSARVRLSSGAALPTIDESAVLTSQDTKQRLVGVLENIESRVERLRRDTARLEEEKDTLLVALDALKHSDWLADLEELEREDVCHVLSRVRARCLTVEAVVRPDRDLQQEEALHQVNRLIDTLVISVRADACDARSRCEAFMSACEQRLGEIPEEEQTSGFSAAILGCTEDDRNKVRRRLQGLLDYFARLDITAT